MAMVTEENFLKS